jgi:hypothetical protein
MKTLNTYIIEAQSEWEQKHDLINSLVKAGVGETSHLWLATIDELKDMARKAGILDEAPMTGIQPISPTTSMTDKPNQPQGSAQTTQGVKPVSPAANVQISTGSTNQTTQAPSPGEIDKQVKTILQNPQIKTEFEELLKKMVAQAGIK